MIYDLIKTSSKEEFVKAIRYFEFIGARNDIDLNEKDFDSFSILVIDSMNRINAFTESACTYDSYNEISIPARFLNRKIYTKEEAMEEFNCMII